MKKLAIVLGVVLLVGGISYSVFARGYGGGDGCSGWGYGKGHGYCYRDQGPQRSLTSEQQQKLNGLEEKFFNETSALRNQMWTKQNEMTLLLNEKEPNAEKLRALQKEINQLRTQISEKRLDYRLESNKVAPEGGYGMGYGYGRGHRGYRGNWGGPCWN